MTAAETRQEIGVLADAVEPVRRRRPASLWEQLRRLPILAFVVAGVALLLAILAPVLPLAHPGDGNLGNIFVEPMAVGPDGQRFVLGSDQIGRDLLARIVWGVRTSMVTAFAGVAVTCTIGTLLGLLAGFFRGWVDTVVMRTTEVVMSLPGVLAAIPVIAAFGPGIRNLILVLAILGWGSYARIVRAEVLTVRERDYIWMAVVSGCSNRRIMLVHILPNVFGSVIVLASLNLGSVIIFESGLSFLGLGVVPPDVSLGLILAESRAYFTTAWWLMFPGVALTVMVLAFNFIGDWVRDRLDPRRV
jgi:peptide/nickel transport system permease protein